MIIDSELLILGDDHDAGSNEWLAGFGTKLLDIDDINNIELIDAEYDSDLKITEMKVVDNIIYQTKRSSSGDGEFVIMSIDNRSDLRMVSGVALYGEPAGLHVNGDRVYVGVYRSFPKTVSSVWEIDVSSPSEPEVVDEYMIGLGSSMGFATGSFNPVPTEFPPTFHLASPLLGKNGGLVIFGGVDINNEQSQTSFDRVDAVFEYPLNPTAPIDSLPKTLIGALGDSGDSVYDAVARDDYVYIATRAGIRIFH